LLTDDFLIAFKQNYLQAFDLLEEDLVLGLNFGTVSFKKALELTSKQMNKNEVYKYYSRECKDIDIFGADLTCLMQYRKIIPNSTKEEIDSYVVKKVD